MNDTSKTADSIFYQRYGVPIQGTNYDKKIVKTSRQPPEMSKITSEDWPDLTKISLKIVMIYTDCFFELISENKCGEPRRSTYVSKQHFQYCKVGY